MRGAISRKFRHSGRIHFNQDSSEGDHRTPKSNEKKTNIFLRCNEPKVKIALELNNASEQEIFSKLRDLKDSF